MPTKSKKKPPRSTSTKISKVCNLIELTIGIAFPTSISPNNIIAQLSPLELKPEAEITLKAGNMVKISLGAYIDGFPAILADTIIIPESVIPEKKANCLQAGWLASEATIHLVIPGFWGFRQIDRTT